MALEHVGGAAARDGGLEACPHDGGVAPDRHAEAEQLVGLGVGGEQLLHLAPVVRAALVALEDVGGAGAAAPGILEACPHDGGVAAERHAPAELVAELRVGGGELLHLAPVARAALVALEDVGGAGGAAPGIFAGRPHDGGVAADRHAEAEEVVGLGVGGEELPHLAQERRLSAPLAGAEASRAG